MKKEMSISDRYWRKNIKSAMNPIRIFTELIINSADSYERLFQQNKIKPPFKIQAKYFTFSAHANIEVKDDAEGIESKILWKKLEYGGAESGLDEGFSVRGAMGIGLKDACMAMKNSTIVSVRDKKLSEFKVTMEGGKPFIESTREDVDIQEEERRNYNIIENGTIVTGTISKELFPIYDFDKMCRSLSSHFMMRKLLQCNEYKVILQDGKEIKLESPQLIGELLLDESFDINYEEFGKFLIKIKVFKAKEELNQSGEFRKGGLIHFHDKYAVVDCTLWGFDNDPHAKKLFGEVEIVELKKLLNKDEDVVDEKRRGLNKKHPFVENLVREIERRLRIIIDHEKRTEKRKNFDFDEKPLKDALKEINKIVKDEIGSGGDGPPPPPELKVETIAFYPESVKIKAYQERTFYLVINPKIISEESEIILKCDNDDIKILTDKVEITKPNEINEEEMVLKTIKIYSEKQDATGKIDATLDENYSASAEITVVGNPLLSPLNGFAFVPEKTSVVGGNEKNVNLAIDQKTIRYGQKIQFTSSNENNVSCPKEIEILTNLDQYKILADKIIVYSIPIKGKVHDKKECITATTDKRSTTLAVKVITPSGFLFNKIEFRDEDNRKIAEFVAKESTIYVYTGHPLMKKYLEKDKGIKSESFLTFSAEVITRVICLETIKEGISRGSSKHAILNPNNKEEEIQIHADNLYYEKGSKLHDVVIGLIKYMKKK